MLGSTVFSRVFLYVTQLIIKVPSVPVRLSCVTHPIRVMEQPLVAANDSQQVAPANERQCSSAGFTPWPTATVGVHPRIHSRSHFVYLTPLSLSLSLHFSLILLHLCDCSKRRHCHIIISSNICSTVCMSFLSPDFCKGDKILHHAIVPFRSGGEKSVSGAPPAVS